MDTIAINANEALNEGGQDKKKVNISENAKAAMAAGVTGLGAGIGAKAVADALNHDPDGDIVSEIGDIQDVSHEETAAGDATAAGEETTAATEETIAEVNPDEVMLEEPVAEISVETDMIAEVVTHPVAEDDYRPFAGDDRITDEVLPVPEPEDDLLAENTEEIEAVPEDDSAVDMICGVPAQEELMPEDAVYPEDDLNADNGLYNNDYDVQSDLMA